MAGSRPSTPLNSKPPFFQSTLHGARVITHYSARLSSPLATRNPTTPLNRTHELTPEEGDGIADELEPVLEGDMSKYTALDQAAQQDWLHAVAALPTPEPDYDHDPIGRVSLSPSSNGRPGVSLSAGRNSSSTENGGGYRNSIGSGKTHRKSSSLACGRTNSISKLGRNLLPPIELQPPSPA